MFQLIKKSFKSIFSNKVFSLILMAIIAISSLTFTLLQSSTNSFKDSYNSLTVGGNLHDAFIKELFQNQGTFDVKTNLDSENNRKVTFQVNKPEGDYADFLKDHPEHNSKTIIMHDDGLTLNDLKTEFKEELEKLVQNEKPKNFKKTLETLYQNELILKHTQSLSVNSIKSAFKFVNTNSKTGINDLVIYDGFSKFTNPLTELEFKRELNRRINNSPFEHDEFILNKLKGYKWIAQSLGSTIEITDPSSFQAIISPSYANLHNKKAISPQEVLTLYKEFNFFENLHQDKSLLKKYEQNLIWVDKTPYFIIGVGTSPDFSFPIIDHTKPIPIPDQQAIIFTNSQGYKRIFDGFRNGATENYFSLKFKSHVDTKHQNQIMQEIEEIARKGKTSSKLINNPTISSSPIMTWPNNIKIVTLYDDVNDQVLLVSQRILFLKNLKETINILTVTTTSFLVIFISAIILLIFKSLLSIWRTKHATLMALGYSKSKIAFSIALITSLLIGAPSTLGYLIGHFLQYPFINIFSQYWTIPTYGIAFSIISLMITVITPLVLGLLMVFSLTYWDLNMKLSLMLNGKSKVNFSLTKLALKPLNWTNVKVKYVASLTFSNIGRLILSSLAGVIAVSAILVGLSSIGKAEHAYNQTVKVTQYSYQTNLSSPTKEGGQYNLLDYQKAIDVLTEVNADNKDQIHWHIPSFDDLNGSNPSFIIENSQFQYAQSFLKNKLQFKPLIDVEIAGINSWEIAKKLMPENQRNTAENNELKFYELAVRHLESDVRAVDFKLKKWWPKVENNWKINSSDKMDPNNSLTLDSQFVAFIKLGLEVLRDQQPEFNPYIITYNVVLYNGKQDESYTFINTHLNRTNYSVIGVNPKTQHLNLPLDIRTKLANYSSENNKHLPLVINRFMAEKQGLKINQILNLPVQNHANRNQIKGKVFQDFEVIDILDTYDNDRLITTQTLANQILSLDKSTGFNGIFNSSKTALTLQTLSLYSETGLYLGTDTITGKWREVLDEIFKLEAQTKFNYLNNVEELINRYSTTPYVAMFAKVVMQDISNSTFENISFLSSSLIWIIQIISIALSILFAIIVSSLLISANHKKIATLWTLGYSKSEIMKFFSLIYLLPVILSIGLGLPIAIGVLSMLRHFVINFGSILIPFALSWWAILLALLFIGGIFVLATTFNVILIKNKGARNAIQET